MIDWRKHRIALALACWVFCTCAYFWQSRPDWNVNSRLSLTYAIVEKHSFAIDDYRRQREFFSGNDCAEYDGHFYSDKAPGVSLLGVFPLFAAKTAARLCGQHLSALAGRYLVTLFTSGLFAALTALLLFALLRKFECEVGAALWLTAAGVFGTMLIGYGTLFYSYSPAVFFAFASYAILLRSRLSRAALDKAAPLLAAGLCLGAALLCELTLGLVAVGLSGYLLLHPRAKWRLLIYWAGVAIPLLLFAAYTLVCFDEICIPYKHLVPSEFTAGMSHGFMGVNRPEPAVLWYITLHPYRGLFFYSPFLLLSLVGLIWMGRERRWRSDCALSAFVLAAYLWLNASYNHQWWGGWTYGPRHLIPALPFLIPPLIWVWRRGPWWRGALLGAAGLAVALNLAAVAAGPNYPQGYEAELAGPSFADNFKPPLLTQGFPALAHREPEPNLGPQPNLGHRLGLRGPASLLPLGLLWVFAIALLMRWLRTPAETAAAPPPDA